MCDSAACLLGTILTGNNTGTAQVVGQAVVDSLIAAADDAERPASRIVDCAMVFGRAMQLDLHPGHVHRRDGFVHMKPES